MVFQKKKKRIKLDKSNIKQKFFDKKFQFYKANPKIFLLQQQAILAGGSFVLFDSIFIKFLASTVNSFFKCGKKGNYDLLVFNCSKILKNITGMDFVSSMFIVFKKLFPFVLLASKQKKGKSSKFGVSLSKNQTKLTKIKIMSSWFRQAAQTRSENYLYDRICGEILDILENRGKSISFKKNYYLSAVYEIKEETPKKN